MKLSPHTRDIVRNAYNRAAADRQEAEAYVARARDRLIEAQRALAEAWDVERDLAATMDAHQRAIADEEAANAAERAQRERDAARLGVQTALPVPESGEPLRGKESPAPALGPRGEWKCCGGPHTSGPRNPLGHAVGCDHYGDGSDDPILRAPFLPRPRQEG